jgi:alpha-L-arabinofuranosidase
MTLDIFNRHPEKIAMANCAQLINCLNSLYLAHEDRFVVTPVGYVFEMYAPHQGGQAVRTMFSSPSVHYGDFHHVLRSGATLSCVDDIPVSWKPRVQRTSTFTSPTHLASVITLKPANCFQGLHHSLRMLERCYWSSS